MMSKYEIWFGKDPGDLEFGCCWPDIAEHSTEFKNTYVAEVFATDDEKEFWNRFIEVNEDPIAMWYWVIIDGSTIISGAIDPDDIYFPCVPAWVRNKVAKINKGEITL